MASPFAVFRKHQKVLMVVLTGMAMFAFVILGSASPGSGSLPPSLIFLTLVCACSGALWVIGTRYGRASEFAIVGAFRGIALGFVGQRLSGPTPVVETNIKKFSRQELTDLVNRRRIANQFVQEAFRVSGQNPWTQPPTFGFGHPPEQIDRDVLLGYLFRHEARQMGIVVSNDAVIAHIKRITGDKLNAKQFKKIRDNLQLSGSALYDILRDELQALQAVQMAAPRMLPTPERYWDLYQKLNVRQELDVAAVPVDAFTADVEPPGEAELYAFFEQHKTVFPNQKGSVHPGFRQPRKVKLAYLEADFKTFEAKISAVTDEDVAKYYEENKDLYSNNVLRDEDDTDGEDPSGQWDPFMKESTPDGEKKPDAEKKPDGAEPDDDQEAAGKTEPDKQPTTKDAAEGNAGSEPQGDDAAPEQPKEAEPKSTPTEAGASTAKKPAEKPAETKASAAKKPGEKPAETKAPTEKPDAAGKPDEKKPDEKKSDDKKPDDKTPDEPEPLPEFKPLEDVKDEIRNQLERRRTLADMKRAIDRAVDEMLKRGDRYAGAEEDENKLGLKKEIAGELRAYAKKHGLEYAETGLLSAEQLRDSEEFPIGSATEPVESEADQSDVTTVLSQVFGSRSDQTYQVYLAQDPLFGNRFAYWKTDDVEAHAPRYEEPGVEEQVIEAWKIDKARPIAQKRAKQLSEEVGEQTMSDAFADETVNGKKDGPSLTVDPPTERFSWLRESSAPSTGMPFSSGPPELWDISWVEGAGQEFMRIVFEELADDEVGVAPNFDRSIYYVVRVRNRVPTVPADDEEFKKRFLQESLFGYGSMFRSTYDHLVSAEQQQLTYRWSLRLEKKYDVYWHPQTDQR